MTVGTQYPLDRLLDWVDRAFRAGAIRGSVIAQTGEGGKTPAGFQCAATMSRPVMDGYFRSCDYILGHAGVGTIIAAVRFNKPLLVVPRLPELGEHVNDHQVETARAFAEAGYVMTASTYEEFLAALPQLPSFRRPTTSQGRPESLIEAIKSALA